MHAIPWYIALLISVPQTILIIELGFRLFNIKPKFKAILLLAIIIAGLCYLLRQIDIPFALNTLILIASLSLLTSIIGRIKLRYCFISVVLGVIIYGVIESVLLPIIMQVLAISINELIINPWLNLLAFIPVVIIAIILLSIIIKKKLVLYDFGSGKYET